MTILPRDPAAVRDRVDGALETFLNDRVAELKHIDEDVVRPAEFIRSFILGGGKRVRPLFAVAGYLGACGEQAGTDGPENPDAVIRAAASLELIQACALIHDDIIDSSDTRRGQPTIHRLLATVHRDQQWSGSAPHFGISLAILIGDLALAWADDMMWGSGLSDAALARVREPWARMRTEVIAGQMLDITTEASRDESIGKAETINRFKTAAYTIERPLHIGATMAGADDTLISSYRAFGRDIGIAFQLRDDLLGVFGDPDITGKPAGDDLREGKFTVLLTTALHKLDATDPAAASKLRAGVGHTTDPRGIAELAHLVATTGAVDEVEAQIAELSRSGLAHLDGATIPAPIHSLLATLARKATERSS